MRKTFVMRGQTASGLTEVLNFGKYKQGYAYKMTEFSLYPSTNIGGQDWEISASVTAGKTAVTPTDPNFNNDGLISTAFQSSSSSTSYPWSGYAIVNDTYIITQNLILMVQNTQGHPVNWQCRFESVKMTGPEEASVNYKQFAISDD